MKNKSFVEKIASCFISDRSKRRFGLKDSSKAPTSSKLRLEALEKRELLAADLLNAVAFGPAPALVDVPNPRDETIPFSLSNSTSDSTDLPIITTDSEAPQTWNVTLNSDDWENPIKGTLRYAINNAKDGDTIKFDSSLVGNPIILSGSCLFINKSITIDASEYYNAETQTCGITIDGNQESDVFDVRSGTKTAPVVINGLNVINGKFENIYWIGGIYAENAVVTLTNMTISDCAYNGIVANSSTVTLSNSIVSNNGWDGIDAIKNSAIETMNSTISDNAGSGIRISSESTLTATNLTVLRNEAGVQALYDSSVWIEDSNISSNQTVGIHTYKSTATIKKTIISLNENSGFSSVEGNISTISNTAIWGNGFGIGASGATTITNSTIAGNGFGISMGTTKVTAFNTIVALNRTGNVKGSLSETSADNLTEYSPAFVCCPIFDASGKLLNADSVDLRLRSDSPAIDAGSNEAASEIEFDLDGKSRVCGEKVDLGAYEYQGDRYDEPFYSTVVTTSNDSFDLDDDEWSLREAIYYAPEYVTITFADAVTDPIVLTNGELNIVSALAINGDKKIMIDADEKSRAIYIAGVGTEAKPVALSGLTVKRGKTTEDGGGIYAYSDSTVTLTDMTILNNVADNDGGGVYTKGSLVVTNSIVSNNSSPAKHGGGIYVSGTSLIADSTISGNNAYYGGGISVVGAATITNTTVSNNSGYFGGGIDAYGTITIEGSNIADNTNVYLGGGIYASGGSITLNDSNVSRNSCTGVTGHTYCHGGGIYSEVEATIIATGTTFSNNNARHGGGIYANGNATLTNIKVLSNRATASYGGVYVYKVLKGTNVEISQNTAKWYGGLGVGGNTTLAGNSAKEECGGIYVESQKSLSLKNCIVSNNYNGDVAGILAEKIVDFENDYNIVGYNPGFVCEPTFNDDGDLTNADSLDLHLRNDSSAVDAGSNEAVTGIMIDLDGKNRICGEKVDLGAYEYHIPLTEIVLSTYAPKQNEEITTTLVPIDASVSYQWYRVDANGDATAIDGANESSYTPTADDSSYYLKVVASGTGDYALSVEAISTDLYVKPKTVEISNPTEETIARAVHNVENGGTITLAGDATISIASTINVDKSLTIKGADDVKIVFDGRSVMPTTSSVLLTTGNDSSTRRQLYNVGAGKTLTLENVTLQYGYADFGGAIYNAGTVTLTDVTLLNNEASINGGAVFCTPTGTLSINGKTTFEGNSAGNSGGAIMNYGTVTVDSKATSTFEGNNALNFGGAYFGCGAFTVDGTADFTGNYVNSSESKGGAIYNDAYTSNKGAKFQGVVTINGSATFNGNSAESRGGAIMTYGDATSDYVSLKVSGSSVTFTQNVAAYGGAIDVGKSAKATFSGGVDFGTEGDSKSGNTADYGGAIYSAGSVSFTTGGTYDFYNNVANKSGGAICTSNYETNAGSDYVAGSLNLVGSFVFDGNKANGSDSEGLGGAIATATSTTVQFDKDGSNEDKITWKNNFANGYGDCVSIDTTIVQNRNLTPNCFGISDDADYSTFKIIRLEQAASTSPLTPKMLATNAVAATITVGEATKTFGAEGVSPAQLGLDAGTHQALVQYVDANGETSAFYTLELTVDADASLNVRETNIADGRGVKFNFDLVKEGGRAVSVWEIAWGDGTTTRSENWSTSWMAAHYYAKDGVYDVSLTATYLDGSRETFDSFSTQNVGAAPVATTGDSEVLSVVFAEVEDVFDEFDDLDLFVPFGPALPRR